MFFMLYAALCSLQPFITETAANLKGFSLPGSEPRVQHDGDSDEEDDDYE